MEKTISEMQMSQLHARMDQGCAFRVEREKRDPLLAFGNSSFNDDTDRSYALRLNYIETVVLRSHKDMEGSSTFLLTAYPVLEGDDMSMMITSYSRLQNNYSLTFSPSSQHSGAYYLESIAPNALIGSLRLPFAAGRLTVSSLLHTTLSLEQYQEEIERLFHIQYIPQFLRDKIIEYSNRKRAA